MEDGKRQMAKGRRLNRSSAGKSILSSGIGIRNLASRIKNKV